MSKHHKVVEVESVLLNDTDMIMIAQINSNIRHILLSKPWK